MSSQVVVLSPSFTPHRDRMDLYAKYGLDVEMDDNMPTQRRFVRLIIQKMKFSEKRRNSLLFTLV